MTKTLAAAIAIAIALTTLACARPSPPAKTSSALTAWSRLNAADAALMPGDAQLSAWFSTPTVAIPPDRDPWYPGARVLDPADFGAVPDDGLDDTDAIQAAYDVACEYVKWNIVPRAPEDQHGFIILAPGVYHVSQIHPCAGTTLYGYGATLKRLPWQWWLDKHGGDVAAATADAGSANSRLINGWGYHPRIEYRWRGLQASPPMRFVGVTLDGGAVDGEWPDWSAYQFWNAHLAVFEASGDAGTQPDVGNLRVELIDVTAQHSPADCVSVVSNVDFYVRRYHADGCFRGAMNALGNNNYIDAKDLYLTGPPGNFRAIDREPMGTSVGFDKVTGQDYDADHRGAREYWHIRDAVLAGGLDIASSVIPDGSNTAQGGSLLLERVYVLRPHTLNLILRAANQDRSPVLEIRDSWIRGGSIGGFDTADPDGSWWGLSKVRWSSRVRLVRTTLVLAKPSEANLATHPGTLYPTMITLDQTTLSSVQWPDTTLELVDCRFELDAGWETSAARSRVVLRAIVQYGNAGQKHTLRMVGGTVVGGYDYGLYQYHGGVAILDGVDFGDSKVRACSYNPPGWTYLIERSGASLQAAAETCPGGIGTWVGEP